MTRLSQKLNDLIFLQKRPIVPKFGNWGNGDNVPYTTYLDYRVDDHERVGGSVHRRIALTRNCIIYIIIQRHHPPVGGFVHWSIALTRHYCIYIIRKRPLFLNSVSGMRATLHQQTPMLISLKRFVRNVQQDQPWCLVRIKNQITSSHVIKNLTTRYIGVNLYFHSL